MQTSERKRVLVKYPTRQRPAKFMANLTNYLNKSSGKHDLLVILSMDTEDIMMNNPLMQKFFSRCNERQGVEVRGFYGPSQGKIHAINRDIPDEPWDIVMSIADDMEPVEDGWDDIIVQDMLREFPDLNGSLNYNNDPRLEEKGPQGFHTLITLPVIGRKLYDRFGYIYHPDYKSEWCDNEQTEVFERLGLLRHINRRPIVHKWAENQDALMHRNMEIGWNQDRETYARRKTTNFSRTTA